MIKSYLQRCLLSLITITAPIVYGNASQKEDVTRIIGTIPTPLPPPSSYWGENRAKFSDVVARNQEIISPFSNLNHVIHKNQTSMSNLSTMFNTDAKDVQYAKAQSVQELLQTKKEYSLISKPAPSLCIATLEKDKAVDLDPLILSSNSQHSNSYFINTFTESVHSVSRNSNYIHFQIVKSNAHLSCYR